MALLPAQVVALLATAPDHRELPRASRLPLARVQHRTEGMAEVTGAKVVHCKREPFDVYIGRPSKWGNPFTVEEHGRDGAVDAYAEWIKTQPELLAALPELRGRVLGCWCAPKRCHGDVLVGLANV